ncbi:hypothetical protein [Eubacterium aggregans]|uniref:hypothetical protein n=1 Tax=Eubacterium aggregans TaxID=81409 RepID=UPI002B22173C|nr:hypothetical protein [Eubacterium aggregans]
MIINLVVVILFLYGHNLSERSILIDAACFGVSTTFIDTLYIKHRIDELAQQGALPDQAPTSVILAHLPQNPMLLALIIGSMFAIITPILNGVVFSFFAIHTFEFPQFLAWRLLYSIVVSAKIVECVILRYMQPNYLHTFEKEQTGSDIVKNPLPRLQTFSNLFDTVVNDFGFNLIVGFFMGGVILDGAMVIILPTAQKSIIISALILSVIVSLKMVYPVAREIQEEVDAGRIPRRKYNYPSWYVGVFGSPKRFTLILFIPVALAAMIMLWGILTFFHFEVLNFFQYFVIRTACVTVITKCTVALALRVFTTSAVDEKIRR